VPKPDGDIRVDMGRANKAIQRERHPIPTTEEVLHDLNGSTVFSKLDLCWGFHQINIADDVIVYGCGIKQNDKNLLAVLNRPRQCGLTLNGSKCQFRLPS